MSVQFRLLSRVSPSATSFRRLPLAVAFGALLFAGTPRGAAADGASWIGIGTNDNWSNAFNWAGFTPPISDVDNTQVEFGNSVATRTSVDLNADWSIERLSYVSDLSGITQSFRIFTDHGSVLTVGTGGILNMTDKDQFIDTDVALAGPQQWRAEKGDIIVRGARSGTATLTLLSNPGGAADAPRHVFFFGGDGTQHTGDIQLDSGTLRLGNVNAINDRSSIVFGKFATLDLFNTDEVIGALRSVGQPNSPTGRGTVMLGNGSLTFGGNDLSSTFAGRFTGSAAASLVKTGVGRTTLAFVDSSEFFGRVEIRRGNLYLGGGGSNLGTAAAVSVATGAEISIADDAETLGSLAGSGLVVIAGQDLRVGDNNTGTVFTGAIAGTGNLFKAGRGVMTLRGGEKSVQDLPYQSGVNTFLGNVTVLDGTLELGLGDTLTDQHAVTVAAGATLRLVDDDEAFGALAGSGRVELNGRTLSVGLDGRDSSFAGTIDRTGNLVKAGSGTLRLTGSNKFAGQLTVAAGVLELGLGDTLTNRHGVTVGAQALLRISGDDENLGALEGEGEVELGRTLGVGFDDGSANFAGSLFGAGGFTKGGRGLFSFSGQGDYGGRTTVAAGVLQLQGDALLQDRGARLGERRDIAAQAVLQDHAQWLVDGDVSVGATGPAQLRIEDQAEMYISGELLVGSEGTLSLGGGSLAAGSITLDGGAFEFTGGSLEFGAFNGDLVNLSGTLTSGSSPRTSTILGDLVQTADATLEIELAGIPLFAVREGDVQLGGRLVVRLTSGMDPLVGSRFTLLTSERDILGLFTEVVLPSLEGRHLLLDTSDRRALSVRVLAGAAGTPAPVPLPSGMTLMLSVGGAPLLRMRRVRAAI